MCWLVGVFPCRYDGDTSEPAVVKTQTSLRGSSYSLKLLFFYFCFIRLFCPKACGQSHLLIGTFYAVETFEKPKYKDRHLVSGCRTGHTSHPLCISRSNISQDYTKSKYMSSLYTSKIIPLIQESSCAGVLSVVYFSHRFGFI